MARDTQQWKDLQKNESGGGYAYISKTALKRLEREGVLDAEGEIEYSVSTGTSSNRPRVFLELRNAEEAGEAD